MSLLQRLFSEWRYLFFSDAISHSITHNLDLTSFTGALEAWVHLLVPEQREHILRSVFFTSLNVVVNFLLFPCLQLLNEPAYDH